MGKNIVIGLDGTNNEFGERNSSVVELISLLTDDRQVSYYDPGVGTLRHHTVFRTPRRSLANLAGLAFGYGLVRNVEEAYRFLMSTYEEGDCVYLFGFSRGAYTARVLAGLVQMCGLLRPGQANLLPYALDLYRADARASDGGLWRTAARFKKAFAREVPIQYAGLWDTVSSVGWFRDPISFRYTSNNPAIRSYRHAISLDERRAFYRQNSFSRKTSGETRREAWFAGVHSDIGGTYPTETSGLKRPPFEWILIGAYHAGLRFNHARALAHVAATPPLRAPEYTVHRSLKGFWKAMEWVPKKVWLWEKKRYGNRWNRSRPRSPHPDAAVHASVRDRVTDEPPAYRPPNLPPGGVEEPWERLADVLRSPPRHPCASGASGPRTPDAPEAPAP